MDGFVQDAAGDADAEDAPPPQPLRLPHVATGERGKRR